MANQLFEKDPQKFVCRGLDLNHPTNAMPQGKFPVLNNVRGGYQDGSIRPREGFQKVNSSQLADHVVHSIGRGQDPITNSFLRFLGANDDLYSGQTTFTNIASGFSGQPLTIQQYLPLRASEVFTYIANSIKMVKVDLSSNVRQIGIVPPTNYPLAELRQPADKIVPIGGSSGWTNQGAAGSITGADRLTGLTISNSYYPNGTPGWGFFVPSSASANISQGMHINIGSEDTIVFQTHQVTVPSGCIVDAVGAIGGPALNWQQSIQPSVAIAGLDRNALIVIGGTTCRVIAVVNGPNNISCFIIETLGTIMTPGSSIGAPISSFDCYVTSSHTSGAALSSPVIESTVTYTGTGTVEGILALNPGFGNLNLQQLTSSHPNSKTVQLGPNDYVHIGILVDNPANIAEMKLTLDIDPSTTTSFNANDGNENAYYGSISPNQLAPAVASVSTTQSALSQGLINYQELIAELEQATPLQYFPYGSQSSQPININADLTDLAAAAAAAQDAVTPAVSVTQLDLGKSQWSEIVIPVASLIRIGSNQNVSLAQVGAVQVEMLITGTVNVAIGGLWVEGGFGPDNSQGNSPYIYRHRYRSTISGAESLQGPALMSGINAFRSGVLLTIFGSSDPQVDQIDVERFGGANPQWNYIGSIANNTVVTYEDDADDGVIATNAPLATNLFQPWPVTDRNHSFSGNAAGVLVTLGSAGFNVNWARGSTVIVNGIYTTIIAVLNNVTMLVADCVGFGTGILIVVQEPTIFGQPLPSLFGPFQECFFGCGDPLNPGYVYWTNPSDPDSAGDTNFQAVSSAGDIMQNGCLFDSRAFAWSNKRFYTIIPNGTFFTSGGETEVNNTSQFNFVEIPSGRGLFSKWAFCVGPKIWFLSQDGIYESDGGVPVCISEDISPLFTVGERAPFAVNGYNPVHMVLSGGNVAENTLRLCYHNGYVYFDYLDSNDDPCTLVYDVAYKAWYFDQPTNFTTSANLSRFSESGFAGQQPGPDMLIGGLNGFLYEADVVNQQFTTDDGVTIPCQVNTPTPDQGNTRGKKLYGDITLDLNPNALSGGISVVPYLDNYANSLGTTVFTGSSRIITNPIDLGSPAAGEGLLGRNIGLQITWSQTGAPVALYFWEPTFLTRPDDTFLRADDWNNCGYEGSKLIRGFIIEADVNELGGGYGADFILESSDPNNGLVTLQVYTNPNFQGQSLQAFGLDTPQIASLVRIRPNDGAVSWRFYKVSYIFDQYAEDAQITTSYTNDGYPGLKFVQGIKLTASTYGTGTIDVQIEYDGGQDGPILSVTQNAVPTVYTVPYSFAVPFNAHEMRLAPAGPIRIDKMEWIWEPAPDFASNWITQPTTHDMPGYHFLKDGYIAHNSTTDIGLNITIDGFQFSYTIGNSGGQYKKSYILFALASLGKALKGKSFQYSLTSSDPFQLYAKDSEVRVHPWNGEGGYLIKQPFGDTSRTTGARL